MDQPYHKLLKRQIKKHCKDLSAEDEQRWVPFFVAVSAAYEEYDSSIRRINHSMNLSSHELFEINFQLTDRANAQQAAIETLKECFGELTNHADAASFDIEEIADWVADEVRKRNELKKELILERDRANQAAEVKSTFLSMVSHEMRTPINGILGLLQIVRKTIENEDAQEKIEQAIHCSKNIMNLVEDILDYSDVESGKYESHSNRLDLKEFEKYVYRKYHYQAWDKNIQLIIEYEEPKDIIVANTQVINKILDNLVNNAIKFTEVGYVKVSARVNYDGLNPESLTVTVSDSGIGIEESQLSVIFDMFSQLDSSVTREYGGLGIGLTVCKRLVLALGGAIFAQSVVGIGSRFMFTAPVGIEGSPFASHLDIVPKQSEDASNA